MKRAEISRVRTKKVLLSRKLALRKWQARTLRQMSNRKQTLKAKCASEALQSLAPLSLLRHRLPAISFKNSLEYVRSKRRLSHRHLTVGVELRHDERPTTIITAVHSVSSASDRTTSFSL
jgi:hypothetical protein